MRKTLKIVLLKTGTSWVISMERDEFEDMLESFLLSSSTCFVKKALHSKDLNHKRFSKNGGQFLLFLTEFLLLPIQCRPRRDSIF